MIQHAAVKSIHGDIIVGKSHADCFHKGARLGLEMSKKALDQGFLSSFGEYLDRMLAAKDAWVSGQIEERVEILFSELLWSPRDNGKHDYFENIGYVMRDEK